MVNAKNLLSASVVTLAVATIVTYMHANGLTTNDISLVDACYKSVQAKGINVETCDDFKQSNQEWDTRIACEMGYKEDIYYYTPRMLFVYYAGGKDEVSALGRKTKGSSENKEVYTKANNMTFVEAINDRCAEMLDEPEFPIFVEVRSQVRHGVKFEDVDLSKFEDRNLYGWNQAASWIMSALNIVISALVFLPSQALISAANYKACSNGLAFEKITYALTLTMGGRYLIDTAQCGGNSPTRCRRYHAFGPSGWWNNHERNSDNRLNNGCVEHDKCLEFKKQHGRECDQGLASEAWKALTWHWPYLRCSWGCGWRGCRGGCSSGWFGWKNSMGDSRGSSALVWATMDWIKPNWN